jgi:protein Tex
MDLIKVLTTELKIQEFQVANTLALFQEGATVPFVARYRKERTGNLNEEQIRELQRKFTYYTELDERRKAILESIMDQGKLTPELEKKINETLSKTDLEDIYLPYKPKRTTRATKAKEAGLEPLARWLESIADQSGDILKKAAEFLNPEKGIDEPEKALSGACDILAEEWSENADTRKWACELTHEKGIVHSEVKKEFAGQKTKFEMYYDFREAVRTLPSHRILAMMRGESEKILRLSIEYPELEVLAHLESVYIKHPASIAGSRLRETVNDCWNRLLSQAIETEIRNNLREFAEDEAFIVFKENLRALLLAAPAGQKPVMGVDPGFRTGCKVVTLDSTGKFLEYQTIFPHEPHKKVEESKRILRDLIDKHQIRLIAIGNGTASRETDSFIRSVLTEIPDPQRPLSVIVSESGASVYSASELAQKEFPDQDVTVRGAVSIGRRLQDPLSELVKIDPKAIGVGQYQHDVNQIKLKDRLEEVVESCVNSVGVNVNLASEELLKHVAGLNKTSARKLVEYRNLHGAFPSREDIKHVPGMGEKTFEQAAGFLRIPGGKDPLDNSAVHPERYAFVAAIAESLKSSIQHLIGNTASLRSIDKSKLVSETIGLPTVTDILSELEKPGRDPRAEFKYASFSDQITEIKHLKEGMILEGTVSNVANFGAFVDIGVHQDGLVHISELANRFVRDPREIVTVGQVVKVKVMKVDAELKRIALSMKALSSENIHPQTPMATVKSSPASQQIKKAPKPPVKLKFSIREIMK